MCMQQHTQGHVLALGTLVNAVHRMKIARWQIISQVLILAFAVLTAIHMEIVAVILSTYAHQVSCIQYYHDYTLTTIHTYSS